MTEELEVLLDITARLETAGIHYMLSGSMAMNYYAQPRMTRDIDIVVELAPDSAASFTASLQQDYFVDGESAKTAAQGRRMFNAIHKQHMVKIDFVVRKDGAFRAEEFRRRRQVEIESRQVWIVAPEDLLLAKLHWARDSHSDLQLGDAKNLFHAVENMDNAYLERWAASLGVEHLLDAVRK